MKPIIKVENLSKQYRLGARTGSHDTLRDALAGALRAPLGFFRRDGRGQEFWALRGVNFEVMPGEVVGIIGRNGAGKSTLLKILSRITEPTTGRVELYGRVASLLEVGTGFHPELTGRENIFLNGAILGMRKAEIERKFDEIVAFAEIDKFIDTPVKRYSSGMYVRLAFAVAAQLEPEVLVIDEVLAVGDAAFQKKCLGKMSDVARQGRTVLFVSHNMGAVATLCNRGLFIEEGNLERDGKIAEVVAFYQSRLYPEVANNCDLSTVDHYGNGKARFTTVAISHLGSDDSRKPFLYPGQDLLVDLTIVCESDITHANVALIIYDHSGYRLIDTNTALQGSFLDLKRGEEARAQFQLHEVLLKPGVYMLGLWLGRVGETIDGITYAIAFSVEADPQTVRHSETFPGVYQCKYSHTMEVIQAAVN